MPPTALLKDYLRYGLGQNKLGQGGYHFEHEDEDGDALKDHHSTSMMNTRPKMTKIIMGNHHLPPSIPKM